MKKYPNFIIPSDTELLRDQNTMRWDSSIYADEKNIYKDYPAISPRGVELYHCLQTFCATKSRQAELSEPFMVLDEKWEVWIKKISIRILPLDPDLVYQKNMLYKSTKYLGGSYSIVPRVYWEGLDKIIIRMNDAYAKVNDDTEREKHKNSGYMIIQLEKYIEEYIKTTCYHILHQINWSTDDDVLKDWNRKLGNINMMTEIKDSTLYITVTDILSHIALFVKILDLQTDKIILYIRENLKNTLQKNNN